MPKKSGIKYKSLLAMYLNNGEDNADANALKEIIRESLPIVFLGIDNACHDSNLNF
jgi:hypothetical protein